MKITEKSNGLIEIAVEDRENALHLIGSDSYTKGGRAIIKAEDVDKWEECPMPAYTQSEYKQKLVSLIREKYDTDDEMNVLHDLLDAMVNPNVQSLAEVNTDADTETSQVAQADKALQAYQAYNEYVTGCKERAKTELSNRNSEE